jgi:hypothetical protein
MSFKSRLLRLEERVGEISRSPVQWTAIVEGQLIRLGLRNGSILTGPEALQALEEAQGKHDPYKIYLFDPDLV